MSDIICVTNRKLCTDVFLIRMQRIIEAQPRAVILREKDLPERDYAVLAEQLLPLCYEMRVPLFLNGHPQLAQKLGCGTQLPFDRRSELTYGGISVHSPAEAHALRGSNTAFLIAGHIWPTDCKLGLDARGIDFLRTVVFAAGDIPVYAIGGITPNRMSQVRTAGAAGACVMSALMTHSDPAAYLRSFG